MKIKGNLDVTKNLSFSSGPRVITDQSIDPIISGYSAPIGSILINPTTGIHYKKYAGGNNEWETSKTYLVTGSPTPITPTISYTNPNLTINWGVARKFFYNGIEYLTNASDVLSLASDNRYLIFINSLGVVTSLITSTTITDTNPWYQFLPIAEVTISGGVLTSCRRFSIELEPDLDSIQTYVRNGVKCYRLPTSIIIDGDGSLDTHYQFGMDTGSLFLGPKQISCSSETNFPVYRKTVSTYGYSLLTSTGSDAIYFTSQPSTSGISTSLVPEGYYFWGHLYSGAIDTITNRAGYSVVGQQSYSSITEALLGLETEWNNFKKYPIHVSSVHYGAVLYQYSSSFTNTKKSRIVSIDGHSYLQFAEHGGDSQNFCDVSLIIKNIESSNNSIITNEIKYLDVGGISIKDSTGTEVGTAIGNKLTFTEMQVGTRFNNQGMEVADVVELSSSLAMNATHFYNYITLNGSANAVTLTLPVSPTDEMVLKIKAIDITHPVEVFTSHAIDGLDTYTFEQVNESITLIFKTNRWLVF